jgi:hypothetical protein
MAHGACMIAGDADAINVKQFITNIVKNGEENAKMPRYDAWWRNLPENNTNILDEGWMKSSVGENIEAKNSISAANYCVEAVNNGSHKVNMQKSKFPNNIYVEVVEDKKEDGFWDYIMKVKLHEG